jgi:thioesterase domain-containing protein
MSLARQIQELFYDKIPITRAMGVRVEEYDGRRLVLCAPLDRNVNHLGTAFGGSLNALAVLSGYGLLWLELQDAECHIVIRESSISYDRPVCGELRAVCVRPGEEALAAFRRRFNERGRARIRLSATLEDSGEPAVRFEGTFVAMR